MLTGPNSELDHDQEWPPDDPDAALAEDADPAGLLQDLTPSKPFPPPESIAGLT